MAAFLLRRLLSGLLMILTLTFLTFFVFNEIPTNPACLIVACGPHTTTTDADIRAADHRLGIDRPVYVQYGSFVWHLVRHGTFGEAWTTQTSVRTQIAQALPVTASLVAGGLILMMLLALPLGCIAALRPRSPVDRGLLAASMVGLAIQPFVLGITIRDFFQTHLHVPGIGYCPLTGSSAPPPTFPGVTGSGCGGLADWASHLAVPWLVFALLFLPIYLRMIRVRLLETFDEPWITTARAKGASEQRVVAGHALRNAMGPVLPMLAAVVRRIDDEVAREGLGRAELLGAQLVAHRARDAVLREASAISVGVERQVGEHLPALAVHLRIVPGHRHVAA